VDGLAAPTLATSDSINC